MKDAFVCLAAVLIVVSPGEIIFCFFKRCTPVHVHERSDRDGNGIDSIDALAVARVD